MAKRKLDILFLALATAIIVFSVVTIFGSELVTDTHQHHDVRKVHERALSDKIEIVELKHEKLFQKTIKSCIPKKGSKCKEFIPTPLEGEPRKQRIGVLAPPGDMTLSLLNRVEHIVTQHNQNTEDEPHIELISTTHVPPYGYGKSHGYTKLIRVTPQPLLLQVTDALTASLKPGQTHRTIQKTDVVAATRMVLRWHCRVSHIAAHTALYSIPLLDFIHDSGSVMDKVETFLSPHLRSLLQRHQVERPEKVGDDDAGGAANVDDDETGMMDAEFAYGNQILRDLGAPDVIRLLDDVVKDEAEATKGFSKWPCPSFWAHPEELTDLGKRMAKSMSPDCDDPHVQCFVPRDKCEFQGDPECKKKTTK